MSPGPPGPPPGLRGDTFSHCGRGRGRHEPKAVSKLRLSAAPAGHTEPGAPGPGLLDETCGVSWPQAAAAVVGGHSFAH